MNLRYRGGTVDRLLAGRRSAARIGSLGCSIPCTYTGMVSETTFCCAYRTEWWTMEWVRFRSEVITAAAQIGFDVTGGLTGTEQQNSFRESSIVSFCPRCDRQTGVSSAELERGSTEVMSVWWALFQVPLPFRRLVVLACRPKQRPEPASGCGGIRLPHRLTAEIFVYASRRFKRFYPCFFFFKRQPTV